MPPGATRVGDGWPRSGRLASLLRLNSRTIPAAELALLLGMVVAFVVAYLLVSHFEWPGAEALPAAGPDRPDPGQTGNIGPTGTVDL